VRALKTLYLTTPDGTTLGLQSGDPGTITSRDGFRLYQEFCPVKPRVVSRLAPQDFCRSITRIDRAIYVPRIIFADFRIDNLATNPQAQANLPYRHLSQIRFCLEELQRRPEKEAKIVDRDVHGDVKLWMIENGFFIGDSEDLSYFPMPAEDDLRANHYDWWSSAQKGNSD